MTLAEITTEAREERARLSVVRPRPLQDEDPTIVSERILRRLMSRAPDTYWYRLSVDAREKLYEALWECAESFDIGDE